MGIFIADILLFRMAEMSEWGEKPHPAGQLLNALLARAANVTAEGISISSMTEPDQPLVYVNEGFERMTGYSKDEVLGRNCRFLQGQYSDQEELEELREAIRTGQACTIELLNFKKDGTPFWNRLSLTPLHDQAGRITHYVGIQSDITELKEAKERLELANTHMQGFHERITGELEQARQAQAFLLPSGFPTSTDLHFAAKFVPMDEIGGDFFDVIDLGEGKYGVLIADVTGHGIPAALVTFMASTTFKLSAAASTSPAATIEQTNARLYQKMPNDAFVTMFYAVYNSSTRTLSYTQAGHPEGLILRAQTQQILSLATGGPLVGVLAPDALGATEKEIALLPGDRLLLYTDALLEVMARHDQRNGNHLHAFLNNAWTLSLEELFDALYDYGLHLLDTPSYPDDFTLVGFEMKSNF